MNHSPSSKNYTFQTPPNYVGKTSASGSVEPLCVLQPGVEEQVHFKPSFALVRREYGVEKPVSSKIHPSLPLFLCVFCAPLRPCPCVNHSPELIVIPYSWNTNFTGFEKCELSLGITYHSAFWSYTTKYIPAIGFFFLFVYLLLLVVIFGFGWVHYCFSISMHVVWVNLLFCPKTEREGGVFLGWFLVEGEKRRVG